LHPFLTLSSSDLSVFEVARELIFADQKVADLNYLKTARPSLPALFVKVDLQLVVAWLVL